MDNEKSIEREFKQGELESIDAIERLEALGMQPKKAESLIEKWANEGWDEGCP